MSKEILVEVVKAFNYSPNGWDSKRTVVGEELYLPESMVKGLMAVSSISPAPIPGYPISGCSNDVTPA